jgi:quinolinate synthase
MVNITEIENALKPDGDQHLEFLAKRDIIAEILRIRDEKNVLILGHNYMAPLIYNLSPTFARGDSLALSRVAATTDHPVILFDGVRFMAETAKILNPKKRVLIADPEAGCSLADPFSPADVLAFKSKYPDAPVVTYINSYADIKAVSDFCCTSANVKKVVRHAARLFGSDRVIFFPDSLMGANVQNELRDTGIEVVYPGKDPGDTVRGACEVHLECTEEVVAEADFAGSTSEMAAYLAHHPGLERVFLATECEMAANLALEYPNIFFVRSCSVFCKHMRRITLEKIHHSLLHEVHEITVDEAIAKQAKRAITRMLEI